MMCGCGWLNLQMQNRGYGELMMRLEHPQILVSVVVPGGLDNKEPACNAGDLGSIPGLGRAPGEGNGNPLQYSCLENSMDGGAWQATVHGVAKSQTRLSDFTFTFSISLKSSPRKVKSFKTDHLTNPRKT